MSGFVLAGNDRSCDLNGPGGALGAARTLSGGKTWETSAHQDVATGTHAMEYAAMHAQTQVAVIIATCSPLGMQINK